MDVLLKRSRSQAALEKGIVHTKRRVRIAERRSGAQEKVEVDHVMTSYHFLQQKASEPDPKYLQPGEVVAIRVGGRWSTVRLISCSAKYHPTFRWKQDNGHQQIYMESRRQYRIEKVLSSRGG